MGRDARWTVLEERIFDPVARELKDEFVNNGGTGTRVFSFDELREMSVCDEYPRGISLEHTEIERGYLYGEGREEMVDEYGLYFRAAPGGGLGIQFTVNPAMGADWTLRHSIDRMLSSSRQAVSLLGLAESSLPNGAVRRTIRGLRDLLIEQHAAQKALHSSYVAARNANKLELPASVEGAAP